VSARGKPDGGTLTRGDWPLRPVFYERVELDCAPSAPRRARVLARELLGARLPVDRRNDLQVLVTELVTNSVRHAGLGPEDKVVAHLAAATGLVRVEVCDGGPGFDPVEREPGPHGGFGLLLLRNLPDRWGIATDDGTCVWFELDC
jgi:anti-sigma regulatory factor (Ser/Thr protein kinase)